MENTDHNRPLPATGENEIILYQPDSTLSLDVRVEDDTVWLTQAQMTELFQSSKQNISLHINNIFKERELDRMAVVKESLTTAADGKRYRTNLETYHGNVARRRMLSLLMIIGIIGYFTIPTVAGWIIQAGSGPTHSCSRKRHAPSTPITSRPARSRPHTVSSPT